MGCTGINRIGNAAAVVAIITLFAPGYARAACGLKIADLSKVEFGGHHGKGYEVFDNDQHVEAVTVRIRRTSGSCSFVVGFSTGGSGTFGQRQLRSGTRVLNYQLTKNVGATQILKDIPLASSDEVFTGTLSSGQDSISFQLYFVIPLLQIVPPGYFQDSLIVSVYEGSLQSAKLRDQEQLALAAPVPTTAEFVMGDTVDFDSGYRNALVYFGEFFSGSIRELKLHARSNAGYRVTLRSYNASKMRNLDLRERDEVAYTLTIDGASVSLADGTTVTAMQRNGTTPGLGNEHNLRFRVGDLGNAAAGTYLDVIQVTLYPSR